jgi:general secretion pathway protein M
MKPASGIRRLPLALPPAWRAGIETLKARWAGLGPRERTGLAAAAVVLGLWLLWSAAIAPAWRTLASAPAQIDALDAQLQSMQALAAEAAELRSAPPVNDMQSSTALMSATERMGSRSQLMVQDDRATVSFSGITGSELQAWLLEVRTAARARVIEVQLSRGAQGYAGSVVLSLKAEP